MSINLFKKLLLLLPILGIFATNNISAQTYVRYVNQSDLSTKVVYSDTVLTSITLPMGVSKLNNYPKFNAAAYELSQVLRDPDKELLQVWVCGSASPDGLWQYNVDLSAARTKAAAEYLKEVMGLPQSKIHAESLNEDWDRLAEMVAASDIPYKSEVLEIIETKDWGDRKRALQSLGGGKVWKILEKDFFPQLRCVRFAIFCKWDPSKPYLAKPVQEEPAPQKPVASEPVDEVQAPVQTPVQAPVQVKNSPVLSSLPYDAPKRDTLYIRDTVYYVRQTVYVPIDIADVKQPQKVEVVEQQPVQVQRSQHVEVVEQQPVQVQQPEQIEVHEPQQVPVQHPETVTEPVPVVEETQRVRVKRPPLRMGVKTNLIADALVIPTLGMEIQLSDRLSFDLQGWVTNYNVFVPSDENTSVYGFSPELRWWLSDNIMKKGSFIGLHGRCIWYTMQWKDELLYQNGPDNQWEGNYHNAGNLTPAWSAGITYGYSLGLGKSSNWGIEFLVGVGYAKYKQNTALWNGERWELVEHQNENHFGVTRAGINLTYRFNVRK